MKTNQYHNLTIISAFISIISLGIALIFYFWPHINSSDAYKNIIAIFAAATSAVIGYVTKVVADRKIAINSEPNIFISYAREDEEIAENLRESLARNGFKPWLDAVDLKPNDNWAIAIQNAIHNSDFFIPVITRNAFDKNGNLQKEIKIALDMLEDKDNKVTVIPFELENMLPIKADIKNLTFMQNLHINNYEKLNSFLKDMSDLKKQKVT